MWMGFVVHLVAISVDSWSLCWIDEGKHYERLYDDKRNLILMLVTTSFLLIHWIANIASRYTHYGQVCSYHFGNPCQLVGFYPWKTGSFMYWYAPVTLFTTFFFKAAYDLTIKEDHSLMQGCAICFTLTAFFVFDIVWAYY